MKNIFVAICLMLAALNPLHGFDGFYVGGSIFGSIYDVRQKGSADGVVEVEFTPVVNSTRNSYSPFLIDRTLGGSIYAGFGRLTNRRYFGFEGFIQYNRANVTNHENIFTVNAPRGNFLSIDSDTKLDINCIQYGIDFRPGIVLTPYTSLNARVGFAIADIKLRLEDVFFGSGSPPDQTHFLPLSSSIHFYRAVARAGIGIEHFFTPRLSLRTDYIFSDLGKINFRKQLVGQTSLAVNSATITSVRSEHIYNHAVLFGLSYHFTRLNTLPIEGYFSEDSRFRGGYIGGGIGAAYYMMHQNTSTDGQISLPDPFPILTTDDSPYLRQIPFQGICFLGYGLQLNRLFLGAEGFVQGMTNNSAMTNTQSLFFSDEDSIDFRSFQMSKLPLSPWQYGIDLRPGLILSSVSLIYARFGVAAAKLSPKDRAEFSGNIPPSTETWDDSIIFSKSITRAVPRFGCGAEMALSRRLRMRFDYCYTNYRSLNFSDTKNFLTSDGEPVTFSTEVSTDPSSHAAFMSLVWNFRR